MIKEHFLFIKRMLIVASAAFFATSIVFAEGNSLGKLLLSGGYNQLFEFNFDDGKVTEILKITNKKSSRANYLNLEKVDNSRFLFETPSHEVGLFNLSTFQETVLFENSSCPTYFESTGELLFSRVERTASGFDEHLYISSLNSIKPIALKKLTRGSASKCPIKLNEDEVIVFLSFGSKKEFSIFNVKNRSFSEKKEFCEPVFGLNDNKLLCLKSNSYFIADYEGKRLKDLDSNLLNKNSMFPVVSLNEINSILVQEYRERLFRSTVINLWVVNLNSMHKKLVAKDFGVDKKGAIYLNR